jgi:hypothetical protein
MHLGKVSACSSINCIRTPSALPRGANANVGRHETSATTSFYMSERVYVENEWYDGPRAGIADLDGTPHRFKSRFDEADDDYLGTFLIWPISPDVLALEVEQWCIFVEWNRLYEAGLADTDTHPGVGGVSARWDELESNLRSNREGVPSDAKTATAEVTHIEGQRRYETTGPAYKMRWTPI